MGQVLAGKWLDRSQKLDLTVELERHREEDRPAVKQAVIEHLAQAIEPSGSGSLDQVIRALDGIDSLSPGLQQRVDEARKLVDEYAAAERKIREELEDTYRGTLHRLRISGTAVAGINIEATQEWPAARQGLTEAFAPRFDHLKQQLTMPA